MKKTALLICTALLLMTTGRASRVERVTDPAIQVSPETALMDEAVALRLSGFAPRARITIKATQNSWRSQATFIADDNGRVEVGKQAPVAGSYSGIDAMGLFWSMTRETATSAPGSLPDITVAALTQLDAEVDGKVVATAKLTRWWMKPGVRLTEVREEGLVAKLFEPEGDGKHPALLVLSGSEGGFSDREAALLASHGYVTFALAYFGVEGVPKELINIPLEYFKKGLDWLSRRASVDAQRLGAIGGSKGGELSLLLASRFPELKAVVAIVPSHVVWMGIGQRTGSDISSWSVGGKPLPFVPGKSTSAFTSQFGKGKPVRLLDLYLPSLEDQEAVQQAVIPVEKINGAVLLVTGKDDQMWPSSLMADQVIARLQAHGHKFPFQHLSYEGAGHAVRSAYTSAMYSTGGGMWALGGTPEANAKAQADARPKVLTFLQKNLAARKSR